MTLNNKNAYTMNEIAVSFLIIAAMAAMALPNYNTAVEKVKAAEGMRVLRALLEAQQAYYYENSVYADSLNDLDIEIPSSNNFDDIDPDNDINSDPNFSLAQYTRTGDYTLEIFDDGVIICTDAGGSVPLKCAKIGCDDGAGSNECEY